MDAVGFIRSLSRTLVKIGDRTSIGRPCERALTSLAGRTSIRGQSNRLIGCAPADRSLMPGRPALNVGRSTFGLYNLVVLAICCLVCIKQPRRRLDERFTTSEKAFIRFGDQGRVYEFKDISASGMRLAGEMADPVGPWLPLPWKGSRALPFLPARVLTSLRSV
jgi:hypothetical protein